MNVRTRNRLSKASTLVFILYISMVIYFVFFSDHYGRVTGFTEFRYNLTPFAEIRRYLTYKELFTWENLITNLAGNILVFSPFGFLVPMMRKKKTGLFAITFFTFLFSLFIESVQLVTKVGVFDVDDLIMNTLGGMVGFLLFEIGRNLYQFTQRKRQRKPEEKQAKRRRRKTGQKQKNKTENQPTARIFRQSVAKKTEVDGRKR